MTNQYDLIIIGTGPAGYTASIYASRFKINHLLIGKLSGGLISEAHRVCNFPSYSEITGPEIAAKFKEHSKSLGVEELNEVVIEIQKVTEGFQIQTASGKTFKSKTILLATGTERRKLGLENEENLLGKGISYCFTCDGAFFKDKIVAVVGGSDAANTASLYLSKIASKVYQIYRKDKLRGDLTWVEQVLKEPNIQVIYNANIIKLIGKQKLERIKLDNGEEIKLDGLFIEIGSEPKLELIDQLGIKVDEANYIIVDNAQKTSLDGVWAAGDVTNACNNFKQAVTACAQGAVAAENIFRYLAKNK